MARGRYTLYGWHQTGSLAVEAALREAGADFDIIPVDTSKSEQVSAAYSAINPRQQLPSLRLPDGTVMTEGAAMLLHVADAFPTQQLAPKPGSSLRATHDRWLLYFAVNIYEGELRKLKPARYTVDADSSAAIKSAAESYVNRHYSIFEAFLDEGPYSLGSQFSVLDIYVWMLAQWMDIAWLEKNCPKIMHLANTVMQRPHVRPVHLKHFGEGPGLALA